MGRLFWKFFLYSWLAQIAAITCGILAFRKFNIAPSSVFMVNFLQVMPMLAAVIVNLVVAAVLAWYFAKPIRSLRQAFTAAEAGNLDFHLDPIMATRRDELAELGRHFGRMAARLREVLDGQRRLLHDVSHEMRSPLARLQAAVGLARQQPADLEDHLKRIELEAERIDALVEELLTLARLDNRIDLELDQEIWLVDIVNSVVEDCDFEARLKGGQVTLTTAANSLVRGNPELLHRAIENVVRNAVKHGGSGRPVTVSLRESSDGRRAQLSVLDNGLGVPEAFLERIFEPFVRPPTAEGSEASSHGLGLTIARRILDAHGGQVRALNRPEGGLCVEILLPLARTAGPVAQG